jgi:hypothetical protein
VGNTITVVDGAGHSSSIELDSIGDPVVSYYGNAVSNHLMFYPQLVDGDLKVLHCGDPACSEGNTFAVPDSVGDVGLSTSLVLDASGYPVVSYYDRTNGDLKLLHCGNQTCTAGNTIVAADTSGDVGLATSIALTGGNPVVSYYDATNGDLKVLHCGDPTCTAGNIIATPDTAGDVGLSTSLAVDAVGHPLVSYYDRTNKDLKVIHCGDSTCVAGNSIVSPDTSDVGSETSLALDAAGLPVVAYRDASIGLKVLRCGNLECSAGNSIVSPDAGGFGEASVVLDAAHHAVVSYLYYQPNLLFTLKVLHCTDSVCVDGKSVRPDLNAFIGFFSSIALDASGSPVVSYFFYQPGTPPWYEIYGDLRILHCGTATCAGPVGGVTHLTDLEPAQASIAPHHDSRSAWAFAWAGVALLLVPLVFAWRRRRRRTF